MKIRILIISIIFEKFPGHLMSSQKNMSYQEILSCKKVEDLREKIIDQEVNGVIAQDIEDIGRYLKDKFGFDISTLPNYKKFTERFYRRNIVIHNNCYPNEKYRKKAEYKGSRKRLSITQKYLIVSISLFRDFATTIKNSLEKRTRIKIG